jgi:hypothetical protein
MNLYDRVWARATALYDNINDLDNETLLIYISEELEKVLEELLRKAQEK